MKTLILLCALGFSGCVGLSPELVAALSRDDASFCAHVNIHGGVGGAALPTLSGSGGYGAGTLNVCRSNRPSAELSISPDGTLSLRNVE